MPIDRDYIINQLSSSSSFYDWFIKENTEIIEKLNQINTFTVEGVNGITAPIDINGKASIGLSGKVDIGISFNGPAYFNAFTAIPNIAVKVPQINSTVGGFTFGTPVRVYWDTDTNAVKYEAARGNDPDQAEVMGVVSEITSSYAYVTLLGKIDGDFSEVNARGIGLTAGWIYFLDPGTTGDITDVEPIATGYVSKPVIMGITGNSGLVLQMRGNYLNPISITPGGSGSNRLILQCDSDLSAAPGLTLTPGMFVSLYYLSTAEKNAHFTNRKRYNIEGTLTGTFPVQITKILNTTINARDAYLAPSIPSNSVHGYKKTGNIDISIDHSGHVLGYLEDITSDGFYYYYHVLTSGYTTVTPRFFPEIVSSFSGSSNTGNLYLNYGYEPGLEPGGEFLENNQFFTNIADSYSTDNHLLLTYYGNNFYIHNKITSKKDDISQGSVLSSLSSSNNFSEKNNYLINGNFNIWQRDQIGKYNGYTFTGNTIFADLWRRRDGITGSNSTKNYNILRQVFDEYQSEIEGNPEYYINVKALGLCAAGISGVPTGYTFSDHLMVGHIIPGAKIFDKNTIAIKFYAKSSISGYPLDVYFARYSGTNLLDYNNLSTVKLTTSWSEYVVYAYINALQNNLIDIDLDDDYCEIGVDFIRAIELANINGITLGQDLSFDLASFSCNVGSSVPISLYPEYNDQLSYCQKYYYTSYNKNETIGSVTMIDSITPVQNCESIFIQPNKTCFQLKWPVQMRSSPSVTFYSPWSGITGRVYNKTASNSSQQFDTLQTSGTIGYGGAIRDGRASEITASPSLFGTNVCVSGGFVNYDELYFHVVADADFSL